MSYGGIDAVKFDYEYGYFYVHREAGYWNRYHIDEEPGFREWINHYQDDLNVSEIEYE